MQGNTNLKRFRDYQIEWLTNHDDIEFDPDEEKLIVQFLKDTAELFEKEQPEPYEDVRSMCGECDAWNQYIHKEPCEDAVSADAVIKAVDRHTDDDGRLDDDISCILEEVPWVKPVPPKCNDAVSREAVKSLLCKETCHPGAFCPDEFCKEICEKVDALPSVNPTLLSSLKGGNLNDKSE